MDDAISCESCEYLAEYGDGETHIWYECMEPECVYRNEEDWNG